jgi:N-acetylneuraminate synthase
MAAFFETNGRQIGPSLPVYIVAELSANHRQDFEQAVQLIHAAKQAGADAVKLQTYTPDTITIESNREYFRIGGGTLWDGRTLHDLYAEAYTPWEWHPKLKALANELGLDLFSSPFDPTAVDFLESIEMPAYKVASCELVDLPLIQRIAKTGKPLIMSTGMATIDEIKEAVAAAQSAGAGQIALLKCTSAYPSPPEEMHLRNIPEMAHIFGLPIGLSDHTKGVAVPVAAVALGACIVEKHLTLSRAHGGPDTEFSLAPDEFKEMVQAIHVAEKALGSAQLQITAGEASTRAFRRSLFVVQDIEAGEMFNDANVRSIRPAYGLHPRYLPQILGKRAASKIERGTPLNWELIQEEDQRSELRLKVADAAN